MTPSDRRLPSIAPDVDIADFDTELVVLVPHRRRAVHLEAGHAVVLDSCRRGHGLTQLVDEVVSASGQELESVHAWVGGVLQEFARLGIIEAIDGPPPVAGFTTGSADEPS